MQVRGRYLVVGWTVVFLAAAGAIAWRARSGFLLRGSVARLETRLKTLQATRTDLQSEIAKLTSQGELGPRAAALGLRFPSDSDLIELRVTHR